MSSPPSKNRHGPVAVALAVVLASTLALGTAVATPTQQSTDASTAERTDAELTHADARGDESNASVRAWRVPHFVDVANATASDLEAYRDADAAAGAADDEPRPVTPGDRLAVGISVDGLDAHAANESGNLTERVLAALDDLGHFQIRQTPETTSTMVWSSTLWLNASNVRAVDAGTDRYVLVVDQSSALSAKVDPFDDDPAVVFQAENDRPSFYGLYEDRASDETYTARFYENDSERGLAASSEPVGFAAAAITLDAADPLAPGANASITGTTTLAPDTTLEIAVTDDAGGTVASATATVGADRTVALALDLSNATPPTTLTVDVAVAADGDLAIETSPATVRVLEPDATVSFEDQTSTTQFVSARANLSHGGVLVLRNETTVLDATTRLSAGSHQTVTFTLPETATNGTYSVVAFRGTPTEHGEPYPDGTATARIELATDEAPSDPDETQTTGPQTETTTEPPATDAGTATTAPSTTADPGTDTTSDDGAIPGFGVLPATAVLAASAALTLARRRRSDDA